MDMSPGFDGASVDYARALEDYCASLDDPHDVSFAKDDILDILSKTGDRWQVRKIDGSVGLVSSKLFVLPFGDLDPSTILERLSPRLRRPESPTIYRIPCQIDPDGTSPITRPEGNLDPVASSAANSVIFTAEALHPYTSEVPEDLSFVEGMALDILDANDQWWRARAPDGTIGAVPSNFMRRLSEAPVDYARALKDFCSSPDDLNTFSFAKDDILDVLDTTREKWHVRKADGTLGVAPPSSLVLLFGGHDPLTFIERLRHQQRPGRPNEALDSAAQQVHPRAAPELRKIGGLGRLWT
ncbi:Transmembrane osmosensor [Marasmius sp. AFHP31]|nr:Transmembrane osmosensor [Marasmius sp. AFHP31]